MSSLNLIIAIENARYTSIRCVSDSWCRERNNCTRSISAPFQREGSPNGREGSAQSQ